MDIMHKCEFCGSVFGDRKCYFCDRTCCTNCMTDDRTRCKDCYIQKRRLGWKKLLKRNKIILIFVGLLWLYAVFPGPFFPGLDPTFYTISIIAAVIIMIPIGLALFFWSLNPPASDLGKKQKD